MKIVGEKWIETEKVTSERSTKNTKHRTVEHYSVRSLLLECGHSVPVTGFTKIPVSHTVCFKCESAETNL